MRMRSSARMSQDCIYRLRMLEGVRVVDRTTQIAGPYCTRLFVGAGAEVVKVEPAGGDPLRTWRSGALFEVLNASQRSVQGDHRELGTLADVLVAAEPVGCLEQW